MVGQGQFVNKFTDGDEKKKQTKKKAKKEPGPAPVQKDKIPKRLQGKQPGAPQKEVVTVDIKETPIDLEKL